MKAISLFSGVGGLDMGLERAGFETVLQAEINPLCREVLARHWPHVRRIDDVRLVATAAPFDACPPDCEDGCVRDPECIGIQEIELEFGEIDLIHGGFPCQDISAARDRWGATGLNGDRSGLWWEFYRVIQAVRPRWVIIENVDRLRTGRGGKDLRAVLAGLDDAGYLGAGTVLDAAAFGLPARRPRVFIVARRDGDPRSLSDWARLADSLTRDDPGFVVLEGTGQPLAADYGCPRPDPRNYRKLTPREAERALGWPDDWTRWTADGREIAATNRYKMIGNGVAAPCAEWLGRQIVAVEQSAPRDAGVAP